MASLIPQIFLLHRKNRTLAVAVFGSLLLHVALLLLLPVLREEPRETRREPIFAHLLAHPKTAPSAFPDSPPPAKAETPFDEVTPRVLERMKAKPVSKPAVADSASVSSSASEMESRLRHHLPSPAPSASLTDAPDAGTLAQYRLAVMSVAKRHKHYPPLALANHWEGKAEIRMTIGADGSISGLVVRSSSGHALLDQHALAVIEQAKDTAHVPPALLGKPFAVEIPVVFTLQAPES